ncbi:hypothetical protein ABT352_22695 [Streptosporangium sp. NPDC000563]|uniref:hypothetical protein n=1 Tax=Streptosporangium sp. NPDC000563 TaxID=3154366 RepID=UPI00332B72FB
MDFAAGTYVCAREEVERLVADIATEFKAHPDYGPRLMEEGFDDRQWTIVWEEGPEEWAYHAGDRVTAPAGTFLEPVSYYVLAVCLI